MRSAIALSAAAFAGLAAAQSSTQFDYPYTIDPTTVDEGTRDYWCQQNEAQCPLICLQQPGVTNMDTTANSCDAENLTYSCVCENGVSPNITEYSQTLPFFICQQWGNNCVANCNGGNTCADKCRADHPCGAQTPYLGNATLASILSAASATPSATSSGGPVVGFNGETLSANPAGGAAPVSFMPGTGMSLIAVAGSIFMGFAMLL